MLKRNSYAVARNLLAIIFKCDVLFYLLSILISNLSFILCSPPFSLYTLIVFSSWSLLMKRKLPNWGWSLHWVLIILRKTFLVILQKHLKNFRWEGKRRLQGEWKRKNCHHKQPLQLDVQCTDLQKNRWKFGFWLEV